MAKSPRDEPKSPRPPKAGKPAYEPPKLLKFEKLEKLIVSGE